MGNTLSTSTTNTQGAYMTVAKSQPLWNLHSGVGDIQQTWEVDGICILLDSGKCGWKKIMREEGDNRTEERGQPAQASLQVTSEQGTDVSDSCRCTALGEELQPGKCTDQSPGASAV